MFVRHCDSPGCDTHGSLGDWLDVYDGNDLIATLCTRWCLARWAAKAEPTEVIR